MARLFCVKYTKMLSFFLVAEAHTGQVYHRHSGKNSSFHSKQALKGNRIGVIACLIEARLDF